MAIIRVPNFKRAALPQPAGPAGGVDGLDAFRTEHDSTPDESVSALRPAPSFAPGSQWTQPPVLAAAIVAALTLAGFGGFWAYKQLAAAPPPQATLSVQTTPAGVHVAVNGQARGATPLALTLAPDTYRVRLTTPAGQERSFDVTLKAGETVVQQVEWVTAPTPKAVTTGALRVQTEPPGQTVFIDDTRRGTSPLTVPDLPAGEHRLAVAGESGTLRRPIIITAGETLNVVMAPHAPAVSAGWLRVTSPVVLQLRAGGDLIGNTETARVMLPAGEHEIAMANEALGFSRTERVRVAAGRTTDVRVALPNGTLSINAVPWAEVWLNGERLGETPLANLSRPIGTYRLTLRHPQFGERQASVTITSKDTARLGVDMRQR